MIETKSQRLDTLAKMLLAHKDVLANILHYAVPEFKNYSITEIINFIDGNPVVGTDEVDESVERMLDAVSSETQASVDGKRTYDVKFNVTVPGDKQPSQLIINVEAQSRFNPGYTLEKRGIYYLSRLISDQYGTSFENSNFDKLKKVYSIWICLNSDKEYHNTITEYHFTQNRIKGEAPDIKSRYDYMSLIMVCLGKSDENNYDGLIKLLDNLLIKLLEDRITAKENLKAYELPLLTFGKESNDMCNISEYFIDEGIRRGLEQGLEQGELKAKVNAVDRFVAKFGVDLEEALQTVELTKEEYLKYKEQQHQ